MQLGKEKTRLSRRGFVTAGMLGGAAVAIGCSSAKQGNWDFLSDSQARTLAAICDQIVPADGFPSASQAGVLYYIDKQLARHYRRNRDEYRHGLEQASHRSRSRFGRDLADLTSEHQLEIVRDRAGGSRVFRTRTQAYVRGLLRVAAPRRQSRRH